MFHCVCVSSGGLLSVVVSTCRPGGGSVGSCTLERWSRDLCFI